MTSLARLPTDPARPAFGFSPFPYSRFRHPEELAGVVNDADELDFDAVTLPEHLLPPAWPHAEEAAKFWYDLPALVAFLAANTKRLAFLTSVLVVPYYHPVRLAKAIATADQLSNGRVWLGVGTGWMPAEFRRLGIPFAERGAITDEYLRALRELWTSDRPAFDGRYISFDDVSFLPRPVQVEVPILVGGTGERPFRRVAELGHGWYPMTAAEPDIARGLARIRELCRERGRDPQSLFVGCGTVSMGSDPQTATMRHDAGGRGPSQPACQNPAEAIARVRAYAALGVTFHSVGFAWKDAADLRAQLRRFATEVIPAFRS